MLTIHVDEVQAIYESQPLLEPPLCFPCPGSVDDEEDDDNAS